MSEPWRKAVAIIAGLIIAATMATYVLSLEGEEPVQTATSDESALAVSDALLSSSHDPLVVRGWVFIDDAELVRLCHGIDRAARPPTCIGPFFTVTGIDPSRLPLETAPSGGGTIRFTPDLVKLLGAIDGDRLVASEILG